MTTTGISKSRFALPNDFSRSNQDRNDLNAISDLRIEDIPKQTQDKPLRTYNNSNIHKMPLGTIIIARLIFQYLDTAKDQIAMASVCRQTRDLVLYQHVLRTEFPALIQRALNAFPQTSLDNSLFVYTFNSSESKEHNISTADALRIVGTWHRSLVSSRINKPLGSLPILPAMNAKEKFQQMLSEYSDDLLKSINRYISNIQYEVSKAEAQAKLAQAYISKKAFQAARDVIATIQNDHWKAQAQVELAKVTQQAEDLNAAKSFLAAIKDNVSKEKVQKMLAKTYISIGDFSAARSCLATIQYEGNKAEIQIELVEAYTSIGDFDAARDVIADIQDDHWKASAQIKLAKVTQQAEDFSAARSIIADIQDDRGKAESQIELWRMLAT